MLAEILVGALIAIGVGSHSGTAPIGNQKLVDELLDLSGAKRMAKQMPEAIAAGFQQQTTPGKLPIEDAELLKCLQETFNGETFYQLLADYFRRHSDTDHLVAALDLARSPLCLKMTEVEAASSSP